MSDTLEQATYAHKMAVRQYAAVVSNDYDPSAQDADAAWVRCRDTLDAVIAAVRAEAQREAFEAGWQASTDCEVSADVDEPGWLEKAFAAYLTRQAGQ